MHVIEPILLIQRVRSSSSDIKFMFGCMYVHTADSLGSI